MVKIAGTGAEWFGYLADLNPEKQDIVVGAGNKPEIKAKPTSLSDRVFERHLSDREVLDHTEMHYEHGGLRGIHKDAIVAQLEKLQTSLKKEYDSGFTGKLKRAWSSLANIVHFKSVHSTLARLENLLDKVSKSSVHMSGE